MSESTNTDLIVQRERELIAWVTAQRQRIGRLPANERHAELSKLERLVRRELSR
jgi:hypothetical protein